jgi:hypothetical protein
VHFFSKGTPERFQFERVHSIAPPSRGNLVDFTGSAISKCARSRKTCGSGLTCREWERNWGSNGFYPREGSSGLSRAVYMGAFPAWRRVLDYRPARGRPVMEMPSGRVVSRRKRYKKALAREVRRGRHGNRSAIDRREVPVAPKQLKSIRSHKKGALPTPLFVSIHFYGNPA